MTGQTTTVAARDLRAGDVRIVERVGFTSRYRIRRVKPEGDKILVTYSEGWGHLLPPDLELTVERS